MCSALADVCFGPEADIAPMGNSSRLKNTKECVQAEPKEQKFLWLNRSSDEVTIMFIRQLTAASLVALALISLPGSTRTATAQALKFCKADAARLCPGVAPGGGKIIECLKQHENEVSIGCGKEMKAIKAKMGR